MFTSSVDIQANILIDSECCARLADFGLAAIVEDTAPVDGSSSLQMGGAVRWMAPEILDPAKYGHKMVSGGVVIEEHGCICPWDDDPGGTHGPTSGSSHHITLLFSHRW